jgi:hypothetical protein
VSTGTVPAAVGSGLLLRYLCPGQQRVQLTCASMWLLARLAQPERAAAEGKHCVVAVHMCACMHALT